MEEVKLTKEQEVLFEVYDKGVQNEDCNLDAYVEKMKQALSIDDVVNRRELLLAFCEFMHGGTYDSHNTTHSQDVDAFLESQ